MQGISLSHIESLVDSNFYFRAYPEAAASGLSAAEHYETVGWHLGYDPSPLFETTAYLASNPDVAATGMNPLEHYLNQGWHEGRSPSALFDANWYLAQNPDVAAAGIDPLSHFIQAGANEGRDPNPYFSTSGYLAANPDVAAAGLNPLGHFIESGWHEGRNPSPAFDTKWYLESNPDVVASGQNPLEHYLLYGQAEHRAPLPPASTGQEEHPGPTPPSFTAVDGDGVITFGGTATGPISVTLDGDTATFSRMGLEARLAHYGAVAGIELADTQLIAPADALSGKAVTGTGSVEVEGLSRDTDLSGVDASLQVTVAVPADTDVSGNPGLASVDGFNVATGATLTVSVLQASASEITGDYALRGPVATMLDGTDVAPAIAGAVAVSVTDAATLADLARIDAATDATLAYGSIVDTGAALAANAHGYVASGIEVTVTDLPSIAQLEAIDLANGDGVLGYAAISDTVAHLFSDEAPSGYVVSGVTVAVEDVATIADLVALDAANGTAVVLCADIADTWQHLLADDAVAFVAASAATKLLDYNLGQVTVAQVEALLDLDQLRDATGGALELAELTYTLADTAGNLAVPGERTAAILGHAAAVEATDPASVPEATAIHASAADAVYDIADYGGSIANGELDAVRAAVDLTALDAVSTDVATAINDRDGAAGDVRYDIRDTYDDIVSMDAAARAAATDITVSGHPYWPGYLSTAEATTAIAFAHQGRTDIELIRGTAGEINSFVNANPETAGTTGLGYHFWVEDTGSNILSTIGDGSLANIAFITGSTDVALEGDHKVEEIAVVGSLNVADAESIWAAAAPVFGDAGSTAARTRYSVQGDVSNFTNAVAARDSIIHADQLYLSGTAQAVHAAQNGYDSVHTDVFGLLDVRSNGGDAIYVTGSDGDQYIRGTAGSDWIDVGGGNDAVQAGDGYDYIVGGTGANWIDGGSGMDTIQAGAQDAATDYGSAQYLGTNYVIGGRGADLMHASAQFDTFYYEGSSRAELIAESGTTRGTRDYITHFDLGDRIALPSVQSDHVEFFGARSAISSDIEPGGLGLSIHYEKDVQALGWDGSGLVPATRVLIDVADDAGHFDGVADMHIILQGAGIDLNWDGTSLLFGA